MENVNPQVVKAVSREIKELTLTPLEDISITFNELDLTNITANITGPVGTPYEGGIFKVRLILSKDFPQTPPRGYFTTTIFHPNVSETGEICVNTLKKDWKADLGIKHVLLTIRCLLIYPNPESALNEEAGRLLLEQYEEYAKRAKMMTEVHAQPPKEKLSPKPEPKAVKKRGLRRL